MVLIKQVLQRFTFEETEFFIEFWPTLAYGGGRKTRAKFRKKLPADFRLSGKPQPFGRLEFDKESEQERTEITEIFFHVDSVHYCFKKLRFLDFWCAMPHIDF